MDEVSHAADVDVDLTEIPPIQQKRIITFVNHFVTTTASYLNKFCQACESRFMEFEYKVQKIEANLLILESQLSSIPDSEIQSIVKDSNVTVEENPVESLPEVEDQTGTANNESPPENTTLTQEEIQKPIGIKACEHPIYARFFKMVRVGIREPAVKLQMQVEGHDPAILDNPDAIISNMEAVS